MCKYFKLNLFVCTLILLYCYFLSGMMRKERELDKRERLKRFLHVFLTGVCVKYHVLNNEGRQKREAIPPGQTFDSFWEFTVMERSDLFTRLKMKEPNTCNLLRGLIKKSSLEADLQQRLKRTLERPTDDRLLEEVVIPIVYHFVEDRDLLMATFLLDQIPELRNTVLTTLRYCNFDRRDMLQLENHSYACAPLSYEEKGELDFEGLLNVSKNGSEG